MNENGGADATQASYLLKDREKVIQLLEGDSSPENVTYES
jgi:hypothetical protein